MFFSQKSTIFSSSTTTNILRRTISLSNQLCSNNNYNYNNNNSLIINRIMTKSKPITTAAALIIGDEVLNGKIKDSNSSYFATFCFKNNIELKHIAVVPDEEDDIVETLQRLTSKYDFIITTGGIGPTHDDITYEAVAKSFGVGVTLDEELAEKMHSLGRSIDPENKEALQAQLRMATIPKADKERGVTVETIYIDQFLWVPVVSVNSQVHIFPGIPQLFQRMLEGLHPYIKERLSSNQTVRFYVATKLRESEIAPYLTKKQKEVDSKGIKLGSYPHISLGINTVSIIGKQSDESYIRELVKDVEINVEGNEISKEEEAEYSSS